MVTIHARGEASGELGRASLIIITVVSLIAFPVFVQIFSELRKRE